MLFRTYEVHKWLGVGGQYETIVAYSLADAVPYTGAGDFIQVIEPNGVRRPLNDDEK